MIARWFVLLILISSVAGAVADTATAPVPINAGADNYKLDLGDVPPSPSTVSGQRIYRRPVLRTGRR